ncbi:MAG: PHP domain-containing protein [Chitinivibrionales bacterium]|nr:PHP domain-containing protein [Chitinivibrionales bacterium]
MPIDLHTHSNESDGSYSVEDLVAFAVQQGLTALGLTDHDTTAGLERFVRAAQAQGITPFPGVEISAEWKSGNCHIVGYGVSPGYALLEKMLQETRDSRDFRNERIICKLNEAGVDISLEEVSSLAGGDVVSRPHMARKMLEKGYVASVQEAFDTYLAKGALGYVDRFRLEPNKAVELLCEVGATVVLAHPSQCRLEPEDLKKFVKQLTDAGLGGIEVYTPYTSDSQLPQYMDIAKAFDITITGGSDFHGASKPTHKLGYYRDNTLIPDSCSEGLLKISA